ncbi:PAS domain S-box protein [Nodularia harveyana UHCC-0300]|uniref:histidine kinase n=1 Tax=Nodularia harveyana UHCC-0300 TaxID=2974287 RepID=A0ABU5UBI6_9CYAN|nr:PAS domain S-box protein [Nodularia harveyana]MEA5580885.1 PAS domain S-box protein [Nodularia harveyana UHCC-0300]
MGVISMVEYISEQDPTLSLLILNSMSDGVIIADNKGGIFLFNSAALEMFDDLTNNIREEDWSKQHKWFKNDKTTPFPTNELPLKTAIQGKNCKDVEMFVYRNQAPEGIWLKVNSNPLKDRDGKLKGGLIVFRDITEQKQTEENLYQQQAQYRSIFEAVNDSIFIDDLETGRLVEVNPATCRMLGYSLQELKEISPTGYVHPESLHLFEKYIETLRITGYFYCQAVNITKNGNLIDVEVTGTCCIYNGKTHGLAVVRDITDRKQAELALKKSEAKLQQQTKELENTLKELQCTQSQLIQSEKMSSLGQLVAGVAHEINNPVNFIYGNLTPAYDYMEEILHLLNLYQKNYPHPLPEIKEQAEAIDLDFIVEDLPKLLSSVKIGAERIKTIVTSLRSFSRMDESEYKAVDIHEGIESTLMILQNRLKGNPDYPEIRVIKEYSSLPLIECYAGQLNQVFINIISNAIDAIEERNAQITTEEIKKIPPSIFIQTEISSIGQLIIRIVDSGIGISEQVQKRLFEPFFTTKPIGKGTGLGLSISYQIITQKHGGSLEFVSALGQGTEFIITIPMYQKNPSKSKG